MIITKKLITASLVLLLVAISGCATMQDVVKAKQNGSEGTTQTYNVNEAQAWEIAKTVFRWEGSDAIEEHKEQNYMLTSSGMNLVSYGAVMGAWIEPTTKASDTKVTVVTKRRVAMNIATTLTESTFHRRFAQAVEIMHKGQPLPAEAP